MTGASVDLRVLIGGDVDTREWRARHERGEVPDAYPYGLDRLAHHGFAVRDSVPVRRRPAVAAVQGRVRRLGGDLDWLGGALAGASGDVTLSWDERLGAPVALSHGGRTPVVTNVIWATDAPPRGAVLRAVRAGLQRARMLFVLSSGQVPVLTEHFGVPADRVQPVTFGVDADFFDRPATHDGVDRDLVVSVGNDRDRDFGTVFRAFAEVRRARPSTRLVVVSRRVRETAPGVTVVPSLPHDEVRDLVSRAAVALTLTRPNLHASGVTAGLEAQALHRPVVATSTAGMEDYVRRDGGMVLVPPGDVDAAASTCLRLLTDHDEADGRGERGRQAVESTFNTAAHAARVAEVLRRALA